MQKTIQLSLLSVALLSQLNAQDITLKPLEVSSTAIKTDELKSTDAVEVYTKEDIEKAHVQNVYEFLNKNTSLFTTSAYGNPFMQKIDMRGYGVGNGYQNIVVTLNGRKMNNVDMVPQLLSSISPSTVQKIEIIKSSGIVVGGDGANAGVINITTKQSNDKEISYYMGSYGLVDGAFYFSHKDETLSINANGEAQKNDGMRDINNQGDKDANRFATGSFNLAYTPNEDLELRLGASATRTDVTYASYLTQEEYNKDPKQAGLTNWGATHQKYDSNILNAGATYYLNDKLSLNADISNEKKKSKYFPSYVAHYDYNSLSASMDYTGDSLTIKTGIDGFYGERTSGVKSTKKDNLAGYIMANYSFGKSSLKAGYRYESVSYSYESGASNEKGDHTLHGAEIGYNYTLNEKSSLFLNYAHSYQAPDIDRFFSTTYPPPTFTPVVVFNEFIEPMTANNYTLGYNNIQKSNKFKISAYYIDLNNEIYYYPGINWAGAKNTNIDKSHKYGLDLYDKYIINKEFNIALNYNYVQAIIDEERENGDDYSGKKLPGVSDHNIKAMINYLPDEFTTLSLTQVYRSEAYGANDFNNNFSQKQDAFNSTDISATYSKDNWEVFAKINNLFNVKNGLWIKDDVIYPVNFTRTALAGFKLKY